MERCNKLPFIKIDKINRQLLQKINNYFFRNNEPITLSFRVRENQPGAMVGQLLKKNQNKRINNSVDSPTNIRNHKFVIVNQPDVQNKFAVSQDGTIYTQVPLDREERSSYQLTILAESGKRIIRNLYQVRISSNYI